VARADIGDDTGNDADAPIADLEASTPALAPRPISHAVTAVYISCWIPFGLAAIFMFRFIHLAMPRTRVPAN